MEYNRTGKGNTTLPARSGEVEEGGGGEALAAVFV